MSINSVIETFDTPRGGGIFPVDVTR